MTAVQQSSKVTAVTGYKQAVSVTSAERETFVTRADNLFGDSVPPIYTSPKKGL